MHRCAASKAKESFVLLDSNSENKNISSICFNKRDNAILVCNDNKANMTSLDCEAVLQWMRKTFKRFQSPWFPIYLWPVNDLNWFIAYLNHAVWIAQHLQNKEGQTNFILHLIHAQKGKEGSYHIQHKGSIIITETQIWDTIHVRILTYGE